MRDENRIEPFLDEVKKVWMKYPDLRFGQLICNLQNACGNDLFHIEEEDFLLRLKELYRYED